MATSLVHQSSAKQIAQAVEGIILTTPVPEDGEQRKRLLDEFEATGSAKDAACQQIDGFFYRLRTTLRGGKKEA